MPVGASIMEFFLAVMIPHVEPVTSPKFIPKSCDEDDFRLWIPFVETSLASFISTSGTSELHSRGS